MAQGVDVLDGHPEDVGVVPIGEQEGLQHHIAAVRASHERVIVAEYAATVNRVATISGCQEGIAIYCGPVTAPQSIRV